MGVPVIKDKGMGKEFRILLTQHVYTTRYKVESIKIIDADSRSRQITLVCIHFAWLSCIYIKIDFFFSLQILFLQ